MGSNGQGQTDDAAASMEVTRLLNQASGGDPRAAASLLPLVYDQLRALARRRMKRERANESLEATALVHEAYLRLVGGNGTGGVWDGRWHFFAAAAEAMRRILVESARRRDRLKRGGAMRRVELDDVEAAGAALTVGDPPEDLLALDEALVELAEKHPDKAQLVKLRFFAGLTIAQAAEALGIATSTADRHWAYARAWLYRRMGYGGVP